MSRKTIEFKELKEGDQFECYGDVHLGYNTRKLCKCIKLDGITAREINGLIFNIRDIDTVFKLGDAPDQTITRIEDFPGVVMLANEHGVITKERLNEVIYQWENNNGGVTDDFTGWCNKQSKLNKVN